jgi:hypothetical protein
VSVARGLWCVGGQHHCQVAAAVQVRLLAVHRSHHLGHCKGLHAGSCCQLLRHAIDLSAGVQDLQRVHAAAGVGRGEEHAAVGVGADDGQAASLRGACQQPRRAVLVAGCLACAHQRVHHERLHLWLAGVVRHHAVAGQLTCRGAGLLHWGS